MALERKRLPAIDDKYLPGALYDLEKSILDKIGDKLSISLCSRPYRISSLHRILSPENESLFQEQGVSIVIIRDIMKDLDNLVGEDVGIFLRFLRKTLPLGISFDDYNLLQKLWNDIFLWRNLTKILKFDFTDSSIIMIVLRTLQQNSIQ